MAILVFMFNFEVQVLMKRSPILLSLAALSLIAPRLHAEAEIDILRDEVRSLKLRVFAMEASSVMALAPFVTVDPHPELGMVGPNIIFHGANVHIRAEAGGRTKMESQEGWEIWS